MRTLLLALALVACNADDGKDADDSGVEDETDLVLSTGFDEETRTGTAAGEVEDTTCGAWFPAQPQLKMTLEENMLAMHLQVDDTEQAIRVSFATGDYCSNAENFPLPTVESGAWGAGDYDIFVGTVDEGGSGAFTLTVAEGNADAY